MNQYYRSNKQYLESLKPRKYFSIIIIVILLIVIFTVFSIYYPVSNYIKAKLYISCDNNLCHYYIYSLIDNTKIIKNSKIIKIDKNNYAYKVLNIGQVNYDEITMINYQLIEIKLKLNKKYQINNLYLDAYVKTKEEKLIRRLLNIVLEKE